MNAHIHYPVALQLDEAREEVVNEDLLCQSPRLPRCVPGVADKNTFAHHDECLSHGVLSGLFERTDSFHE